MKISQGTWWVFPNPNTGENFTLSLLDRTQYKDEHIKIRLISTVSGSISLEGRDLKEISDAIQESLKKSPQGVYILEISWGQKMEYIKILKRN